MLSNVLGFALLLLFISGLLILLFPFFLALCVPYELFPLVMILLLGFLELYVFVLSLVLFVD